MQNYYRINVAKDGYYLFATEQGRITTRAEADSIIALLRSKFFEAEGYKITCIYWKYTGDYIS